MSNLEGYADAGLRIHPNNKPARLVICGRGHRPSKMRASVYMAAILIAAYAASSYPITQQPQASILTQSVQNFALVNQTDLYREIFTLQSEGRLAQADAAISKLTDQTLLGHILAERYLHLSYKASYTELKNWLSHYADHPQAERIARLANRRKPAGVSDVLVKASYAAPKINALEESGHGAKSYKSKIARSPDQEAQVQEMLRGIRTQIQQYGPGSALNDFNSNPTTVFLDHVEQDRVLAQIASGYLFAGKTNEAEKLAAQAMRSSRAAAPLAAWVHGLSKYRMKQYGHAAKSFEVAASSPYASGSMVSAASYWAGRSFEKAGNDRRMHKWMARASEFPRSFYGLLAVHKLGVEPRLDWNYAGVTFGLGEDVSSTKAGQRAKRLADIGEFEKAEAELRGLYIAGDKDRQKSLMNFAHDLKLPAFAMKIAHSVSSNKEDGVSPALYPSMPWEPTAGYKIDRALLHAIARQESRFNPSAENKKSGAAGLMQIMPSTARHIAKAPVDKSTLLNPHTSLDLGQKYIAELLNSGLIGQDLLSLAMAYNAGPGTLAKWKSERSDIKDPLLFIETIPFAETRAYVERVMANYWIYRMKFNQPNESMQSLAQGRWARYASYDQDTAEFAAAE